jgi:hypothetical protein
MTKPKAQKLLEESRDDLAGILERLNEIESTDPYIVDAKAFILQGEVMLEKHLLAEYGIKPTKPLPPPEVEPEFAEPAK